MDAAPRAGLPMGLIAGGAILLLAVNSLAAKRTLRLARRQFLVRGCRVFTPGEQDYKHCLYANLKFCTAPCIGNVTREQYLDQVRAACEFLAGQCEEMQGQLEGEMKKAAAGQDYERAAELRDRIRALRQRGDPGSGQP